MSKKRLIVAILTYDCTVYLHDTLHDFSTSALARVTSSARAWRPRLGGGGDWVNFNRVFLGNDKLCHTRHVSHVNKTAVPAKI